MADTNDKILKALEAIQTDVKDLKHGQASLEAGQKEIREDVKTVDLKVETIHEFNKKAHTQIMDVLVESGEINYQELKKELQELKKRIEQLETRQQN